MREDFAPFEMVPQDDDEALAALKYSKSELFGANLCKLYQINREEGASVLDAFEKALLAGVGPGERQDAEADRSELLSRAEVNMKTGPTAGNVLGTVVVGVRLACDCLTDEELVAINMAAQFDRDPRDVAGYEKAKALFTEGHGTKMHDVTKMALAKVVLQRIY